MQKKLHRTVMAILVLVVLVTILATGCSAAETGTIKLSITDAPLVDASTIQGVFVTITSIEYNLDDTWIEDPGFVGPQTFDLLSLTGGTVELLSNTVFSSGNVNQVRFMVEAQAAGSSGDPDPGCYLLDTSDVKHELFVPSASETGYKATGTFTVPVNGEVEITADFDVRKSIHQRSSDDAYILQPTIRLVVNNQAGTISGDFTDNTGSLYDKFVIFAYESGDYADSEAVDTGDSPLFENAVTSAIVDSGTYTLPFLAAGSYDLIVTGVSSDGTYTVLDSTTYASVDVVSDSITTQDITAN